MQVSNCNSFNSLILIDMRVYPSILVDEDLTDGTGVIPPNFCFVPIQIVQKTFVREGEGKSAPNQVAGEILSFFTRNNFVVLDRGETVT